MPVLPLLDGRMVERINARIEFLRALARFNPPGYTDDAPGVTERARDVSPLFVAADLAMAIGRTRDGLVMFDQAVSVVLRTGQMDPRVTALPGAILGTVRTLISDGDVSLLTNAREQLVPVPIPPLTPAGLRLRTELYVAWLTSNLVQWPLDLPEFDFDEMVTGDPIVGAVLALHPRSRYEATGRLVTAFTANAAEWAEGLRMLRADTYHWEEARFRAPLVDLRRLAVEVALRRSRDARFPWYRDRPSFASGLAADLERFAAALAEEIEPL
jgi:hypothetical protein